MLARYNHDQHLSNVLHTLSFCLAFSSNEKLFIYILRFVRFFQGGFQQERRNSTERLVGMEENKGNRKIKKERCEKNREKVRGNIKLRGSLTTKRKLCLPFFLFNYFINNFKTTFFQYFLFSVAGQCSLRYQCITYVHEFLLFHLLIYLLIIILLCAIFLHHHYYLVYSQKLSIMTSVCLSSTPQGKVSLMQRFSYHCHTRHGNSPVPPHNANTLLHSGLRGCVLSLPLHFP